MLQKFCLEKSGRDAVVQRTGLTSEIQGFQVLGNVSEFQQDSLASATTAPPLSKESREYVTLWDVVILTFFRKWRSLRQKWYVY
jgi:hypothetical protein